MKTVNGKKAIVSGGINNTLTFEEMMEFDSSTKIELANSLNYTNESGYGILKYCHKSYKEEVKKIREEKNLEVFSFDYIKNQNPSDILKRVYDINQKIVSILEMQITKEEKEQGKRIHQSIKELNFGADFCLSPNQLKGFVQDIGQWNDFTPSKIIKAIEESEKILPTMAYGENNPNTGKPTRQWRIYKAWIYIESGYCTGKNLEAWKEIEVKLKKIWEKALIDNFRFTIEEEEEKEIGMNYIMYWG